MNLVILDPAEQEYREAALWYDDRERGRGDDFLDELHAALTEILAAPTRFSLLETIPQQYSESAVRRHVMRRYRYLIIFRVVADDVEVIAVSHPSRQPNYWMDRLS